MRNIIFILIALSFSSSYACSLVPTTKTFIINTKIEAVLPVEPKFKVSSLSRGKKAKHSCSGLASLRLDPGSLSSVEQGYIFEIYEGSFEKIHFKNIAITSYRLPQDTYEFIFPFYETKNEPINFTLKITSVSRSGLKSKPQFLKVIHKGIRKSWWPSWSQKS